MAASASVSSNGTRYALEDPALPKPWRGLIDGKTGYLYFWNPVTNITQYERPAAEQLPLPPPPRVLASPLRSASVAISSSVQFHPSSVSSGQRESNKEGGRFSESQSHQNSRLTSRGHGSSDTGVGLSAEAYRRHHEIAVTGGDGSNSLGNLPEFHVWVWIVELVQLLLY